MEPDAPLPLLARVRWGNVARAAALVVLAAIILAWPHLRARDPLLPPARPVPVAPDVPAAAVKPAPVPVFARPPAAARATAPPPIRAAPRDRATKRPRPAPQHARPTPRALPAPVPHPPAPLRPRRSAPPTARPQPRAGPHSPTAPADFQSEFG